MSLLFLISFNLKLISHKRNLKKNLQASLLLNSAGNRTDSGIEQDHSSLVIPTNSQTDSQNQIIGSKSEMVSQIGSQSGTGSGSLSLGLSSQLSCVTFTVDQSTIHYIAVAVRVKYSTSCIISSMNF